MAALPPIPSFNTGSFSIAATFAMTTRWNDPQGGGHEEGRGSVAGNERRWTVACMSLLAVLAAVDAELGGGLETVLVASPVVASAQLSPRRTATIGALAVATGATIAGFNGHLDRLDVALRLVALVAIAAFCVGAASARERREHRMARLARVADAAQQAILRPVPARVGHVGFATRYLSAAADAIVGGDLYDVVATPGGAVRLVVGDVRGKGLDAVRLAAVVLGLFREAAAVHSDLAEVAKAVDTAAAGYLDEEDFVTAVFVEFDPGGELSVLNCGHHPPLRIGPLGVETLTGGDASLPLGLGPEFVAGSHTLAPGERLLVYTDGLIEARDRSGMFFDLALLPAQFLAKATLEATLDALVKRLLAHVGGHLSDDMALVLAQQFTS